MSIRENNEKLLILFVYEEKERARQISTLLEEKLKEYEMLDSIVVSIKDYRNKVLAAIGIKQLKPVMVIVQTKMWNKSDAGFELLEYFIVSIAKHEPFYSILHGSGFDDNKKRRSFQLHQRNSYHLGTCSADIKADELLITKIVGVMMQIEDYVLFHHLETPTAGNVRELIGNIITPLYPLKQAMLKFRTGEGKCFEGIERLLLNLEYEVRKIREYYNELFNMEVEKRRFGKIDERMRIRKTDFSIDEVFSEISIFLTDVRSPLVQLVTWMKTIDSTLTHYFQIYHFLESKIGDYQVLGYCKVFLTRFAEFERNLKVIEDYIGEKV
ncbi:MAG: hypothetical protein K8T10_10400 [Candidatus Eremiobacteraeota bacterium]|nr:hypothetical protein [Candidatus Eremiobacteraeota bacterium]